MDIKDEQVKNINQYRFSDSTAKKSKKGTFKAKFNDCADWQELELENLYILSDLSTSVSGNWIGGNSRLDSLYQVALNSRLSLKAKNRNLFYTTKFSVSGQHDPKDISSTPMSDSEKDSISKGLQSSREIYATKNKIDVQKLVSNIKNLDLDNSYIADLSIIGNMYGMSKDVLDIVSKGSTYENKEKAIGAFIDYSMMPKVQQHSDLYEILFDKEEVRGSFKHLPFNAVFESEKIVNTKTALEALQIAVELGLDESVKINKLKEIYGY
jgi:phage portal protein BeeE